jgi:hypothetical protein
MSYIAITLNHFRAIKSWADQCDAEITLNARSFELDVKYRNRYYTLKPRFVTEIDGRLGYTTGLGKDAKGFIGWLPYDILRWEFAQSKLTFKKFLGEAGLRSPGSWSVAADPADEADDFLVKASVGSFGYQIHGPYRRSEKQALATEKAGNPGSVDFCEQFILGTNLKVWFWGADPIYAHVHSYPTIIGDGTSTAQELITARLNRAGVAFNDKADTANLLAALTFQSVALSDVLPQGKEVWIDFRYGRQYQAIAPTAESDNDLGKVDANVREQINHLGLKVGAKATARFKASILYAADGVVDEEGRVWWLEVNSNPMLPPEGYEFIFASLFGLAKQFQSLPSGNVRVA